MASRYRDREESILTLRLQINPGRHFHSSIQEREAKHSLQVRVLATRSVPTTFISWCALEIAYSKLTARSTHPAVSNAS